MIKILIVLPFALLMPLSFLLAQVTPVWISTLQPNESDLTAIAVDNAGGVYAAGFIAGVSSGEDYLIVKYSSSGLKLWQAVYNGPAGSFDIANAIAVDNLGNIYVTGYSSNGNSTADIATVKYNSSGQQQWVVRYNGTGAGFDSGNALAVDNQGNIYLTGYSLTPSGSIDAITIKYNSSGAQQFVIRYNGTANSFDEGKTIAIGNSGFIYVCGSTTSAGGQDYLVIKYNASGSLVWASSYNGTASGTDVFTSSKTDAAGNVYLTGYSEGTGTFEDCATLKYNSNGVQQWIARYNGTLSLYDRAHSLDVDGQGNVYITGYTQHSGPYTDAVTIKYSPGGNQLWAAVHDDSLHYYDIGNAIAIDNSGSIFVSGSSSFRFAVLKYSSSGTFQWIGSNYAVGSSAEAKVMALDTSGGIYLAGLSEPNGFIAKFSERVPEAPFLFQPGNDTVLSSSLTFVRHRWFRRVGTTNYRFQLALDSAFANIIMNDSALTDTVKVTLGITPNTTYWWRVNSKNYFGTSPWSEVWKYKAGVIGIQPISTTIPGEYKLHTNYPNPFNPVTKIRFDVPAPEGSGSVSVKLVIYDALGKEITVLVDENLSPAEYEVEWNALSMPSGVYFYRIITKDYVNSKKMIIVK
jgi:uncharacterized delta-60 repeat protein